MFGFITALVGMITAHLLGKKPKMIPTTQTQPTAATIRTGVVLPLTPAQRVNRMLWLAGELTLDKLDDFIYKPPIDVIRKISGYAQAKDPPFICSIRYSLTKPGGRNPTAIDFGARSVNSGVTFITSDCIGGMAWCGGFDRFQPKQFSHIYGGWINTDSMLKDATGVQKCFKRLDRPEPGCFVVYGSKNGKMGHIGGVTKVPLEWDGTKKEYWGELGTVDMAARQGRGNMRGDPMLWQKMGAIFVIPQMQPDLPGAKPNT